MDVSGERSWWLLDERKEWTERINCSLAGSRHGTNKRLLPGERLRAAVVRGL